MSRAASMTKEPSLTSPRSDSTGELPFHHQPTYLTLKYMLLRFTHAILLLPPSTSLTSYQENIQRELRSPLPYHRNKWLHNIEHARTLLLQLEHSAQGIKVQRVKRDVVRDLAEKRTTIKKLRARIEELGREVDAGSEDQWKDLGQEPGDTVEEILGKPPLQETNTNKHATTRDSNLEDGRPVQKLEDEEDLGEHDNAATILNFKPYAASSSKDAKDDLLNFRRRRGQGPADKSNSASTSGFSSLPTTERALLADSRTHEDLTSSLVSLASQLKQQTRNFQASLDADKGLLDRALEGLDKNVTGMDAASKRMGMLRRMSEGKGWLGRIMLYAWILGLWVLAILLVFVGPKLRF